MALLTKEKADSDLLRLLDEIEKTQWTHKPDFQSIKGMEILTRDNLRTMKMTGDIATAKTSGSTGQPVSVGKSYGDYLWYMASSIREFRWLNWDVSKDIAVIKPGLGESVLPGWGIPHSIAASQGRRFTNDAITTDELQKWLEKVNPHYIHCLPSIFREIDISRITNFRDWKGTGELGGKAYSSEECGIIALTCPENTQNMHVMENQIVEVDTDGSIIITTLTNKYIKRYKHGDAVELGNCSCGRGLQTIKSIRGRVRDMLKLPDGQKKWPQIGSLEYGSFGIRRFQMAQFGPFDFHLKIICQDLGSKEEELKAVVRKWLRYDANITIEYVEGFPSGKFQEFTCLF